MNMQWKGKDRQWTAKEKAGEGHGKAVKMQ